MEGGTKGFGGIYEGIFILFLPQRKEGRKKGCIMKRKKVKIGI